MSVQNRLGMGEGKIIWITNHGRENNTEMDLDEKKCMRKFTLK